MAALLLATGGGCTTSLTHLQSARATPPGKVHAYTAIGAPIASTTIGSVIDVGKDAARRIEEDAEAGAEPSDAEIRHLFRAAASSVLLLPAPLWEVGVRAGLRPRWDAGLAYTSTGLRADTRLQLLKAGEDGPLDLSVGASVQRAVTEIPLPGYLKDTLRIDDFSRTDFQFPVVVGRELSDVLFVYGGGKLVYSPIDVSLIELYTATDRHTRLGDRLWMAGGFAGVGAGYKYVFAMAELSVLHYEYPARVRSYDGERSIGASLIGTAYYPAVGVSLRFHPPVK